MSKADVDSSFAYIDQRCGIKAQVLLKHGADPNGAWPRSGGDSFLYQAIEADRPAVAQALLVAGAHIDDSYSGRQGPYIIVAARSNQADRIVPSILPTIKNINVRNNEGKTALHLAVGGGHLLAVKALLDRGADVNAHDNKDYTPLHVLDMRSSDSTSYRYIHPSVVSTLSNLLIAHGAE
jgi:ankyrin repeat protein